MRIDCHVHIGIELYYYFNSWAPYCLDIPRLFIETQSSGIDQFVVFPFASYLGMNVDKFRNNEIELLDERNTIPYQFENQRLKNEIKRYPKADQAKLMPFVIADPLRSPLAQVRQWADLADDSYKIYGIKIQATTLQSPIVSLFREGSCILDYAEKNNLPLIIHSSIHPNDIWSQCADILRVVESYPGVRFALAHACCFDMDTMLRVAELPNAWFDCAAHNIRCQCAVNDYLTVAKKEKRFPADYSKPQLVLEKMARCFPHKLIWGSDAPFYTCEHDKLCLRSSYQDEAGNLNALPADICDEICSKNTKAWLLA